MSRRLLAQFGHMEGMWRVHHGLSEAVQLLITGNVDYGIA